MSMRKGMVLLVAALAGSWAFCESAAAQWSEPVPVDEINTQFDEGKAFLSFDGLTLYFTRCHTDTYFYRRVHRAMRPVPSGPFTSVEEISALNYSGGHVGSPWVSPDNLRMYYYRTEPGNMGLGHHRIKLTERASVHDPWLAGTNLSELNSLGPVSTLSLTEDELTIVFTGNFQIPGGLGDFDLWIATRPSRVDPFGSIRNLAELNSTAADDSPCLSADGLELYFHSTRNGSHQFFRATRDSVDASFSSPEHFAIFDEPGASLIWPSLSGDGRAFYFSKSVDGEPYDIWVSYVVPQEVAVDIKPGSCPNPLKLKSKGVLPVAILGTEDFDVNTIDIASVRLEGVAPIRSGLEDVATPAADGNECECSEEGPDGYTDLTLKFKRQDVVEQLAIVAGELVHREEMVLTLTGTLCDGTEIEGTDCVVIVGKVPEEIAAKRSDLNKDGMVDLRDFAMLSRSWLELGL